MDVNNLLQQVYVYGTMEWQGSIKFINSFPSPRRGGLFPLISVLSVEGDGMVAFKVRQYAGFCRQPLGAAGGAEGQAPALQQPASAYRNWLVRAQLWKKQVCRAQAYAASAHMSQYASVRAESLEMLF